MSGRLSHARAGAPGLGIRLRSLGKACLGAALFAAAALAIAAGPARADGPGFTHGELGVGFGGGSASLPADRSHPSLGLTRFGATVGIYFRRWLLLGATSDYAFLTQFSPVDEAVGNRRGGYLNPISPTIGVRGDFFFVRADVRFLGSFTLSNPSVSGQQVSYGDPRGARVIVGGNARGSVQPSLFYENVRFSRQRVDGAEVSLGDKLQLWQAGVTVAFLP